MLFFGHVGLSLAPIIVYRHYNPSPTKNQLCLLRIIVASVLPDLIDKPLGLLIMPDYGTRRLAAHTLAFGFLFFLFCRLYIPAWTLYAWLSLGHLYLDGMYERLHTLFFPFLGLVFDSHHEFVTFKGYPAYTWRKITENPEEIAAEIIGLAVLVMVLANVSRLKRYNLTILPEFLTRSTEKSALSPYSAAKERHS